ncbi:MAG TPA: ubiquitin-like domain-containing protein, partial [Candidatus Saccharimonadales bacterium]|nr:ubiquitin-like domain-containing protein [Candidatus Saccharimonadales bacterium]
MHKKLQRLNLKFRRFRRNNLPQNADDVKVMSRHPHAVPVITFAVLITLTAGIYLVARQTHHLPPTKKAYVVIVSHDHEKQVVPSRGQTVGSLLDKLNIRLGQGDVVEPTVTERIDQDDYRIN